MGVQSYDRNRYPMMWQYIHLVAHCLEILSGEARDCFHRTHLGTLPPDPHPSLGARRPRTHPTWDQDDTTWSPASTIDHGQYTSLHEDVAAQPELDDVYLDLDYEAQDHSPWRKIGLRSRGRLQLRRSWCYNLGTRTSHRQTDWLSCD